MWEVWAKTTVIYLLQISITYIIVYIKYVISNCIRYITYLLPTKFFYQKNDYIYQKYRENVQKGWLVSKSYLIYKILARENIYHSKIPSFCPLCEKEERIEKVLYYQRMKYMKDKQRIGKEDTNIILKTQDFIQLDLESGFIQDLILCPTKCL
jgi:hypothetical protein